MLLVPYILLVVVVDVRFLIVADVVRGLMRYAVHCCHTYYFLLVVTYVVRGLMWYASHCRHNILLEVADVRFYVVPCEPVHIYVIVQNLL